ncbi:hypothetical protein NADE_003344 [Nannochloris sp. 'desiccata']|nr:hypothetical protein KSW81_000624 [Chlorella desiccata (nom. nud.)]KAH7620731.1 hypothetical protein NADE_003344 [Chlorella desiccata (nom. nud.)]
MTDYPEINNPNPFNKSQRAGQPHTIKWCAWEILTTEGIATEERLGEIIAERGLRDEVKATSIAKELGSDKYRFVSSPEGWSIIPSFDDIPAAPSRRNPLPAVAAATSPVRKESREENIDDSGGGRRRTKSTSEWWKVGKTEGEQPGRVGGNGLIEDEDEEIDIMTGAVTPAENKDMLLNLDSNSTKEEQIVERITEKKDVSTDDVVTAIAPGAAMEVERGEQPGAPAAKRIKKDSPEVPAYVVESDPVVNGAEKIVQRAADEEQPSKKDATVAATTDKVKAEAIPPLESTQPAAIAPVPAPASKGFIIPKRRISSGVPTGPPTAGAAAAAGGSKEASTTRNNKTSNGNKAGGGSRRPSSVPTNTDLTTAGAAGKPPLPVPRVKQPWENMLQDIHGSFASAWKRLEWPRTTITTSLPQPIDPAVATEEQKAAWEQARSRFGAATAPPQTVPPSTTTSDAGLGSIINQHEPLVLEQSTQDPYPPHPADLTYVRIMQCPTTVVQQCLDRLVFASNHRADTDGIQPGRTLIVLHNFDKHIVYGCYRAVEVGRMLDTSFAQDRSFHVRVEPVQVFSPLPSYLLEAFLPRKYNQYGEPMKFFEKGTAAKCTSQEILRSTYDQFSLPHNPNQLKIFFQGDVWCPQQDDSSNGDSSIFPRRGVLFSLGQLDVLFDCNNAFVVNGGILGQVVFPLQLTTGSNALQIIFSIDKFNLEQPVGLCVGGRNQEEKIAAAVQPPKLIEYITNKESLLLSNGFSIGPRSTSIPAIRASISLLILQGGDIAGSSEDLVASPLPSMFSLKGDWNSIGLVLDRYTAENRLPEVILLEVKRGGMTTTVLEVGEEVELTAVAQDLDRDYVHLEVIVYGVPPENCSKAMCGDASFSSASIGTAQHNTAQVTTKFIFPLPGRYTLRARVSDGSGCVVWKDLVVTVYKTGDSAGRAPCCRQTPYLIAHNLGRPIDRTHFRAKTSEITALSNSFGWSSEYWNGADIEAERLFDYSILAPKMDRYPLETLTCADVRIGGAGGPEVYGLLWAEEDVLGHGKSLTIVPESFQSWAMGASDVECAKHWSYKTDNSSSSSCILGCTSAMIENHIQTTGMVDQYSQALVQLSYGALHVSPRVRVLPEVQVGKEPMMPWDSVFGYYDTPSRFAVEAAGVPRPWMVLTLANMAQHKIPKHRAWSSGIASGSATITKCFASMYYSVHETGHRLGFKHGQLLKLPAGHAVPADPLGEKSDPATIQIVPDEGYSQRLDIMSCCKSDYGLFHRNVAGWLKNSIRTVISQEEILAPSTQKLVLWPFDRSESRGKHISLAIRRSDDEILLFGFRSVSHWQEQDSNNGNNSNSPEDHRLNVRGIQVEYLKRDPNNGAWNERAILDFNVMHGDYPHALPVGPGEISQQTQFSLLKEGRSWYDSTSRLLFSFERIAECDSLPEVGIYTYNVAGFYGFNGEWPGKEAFIQHDYSGYAELSCAHVSVTTAAEPPKGKLKVNIELEERGLNREVGSVSSQNVACIDSGASTSSTVSAKQPLVKSPPSAQLLSIKLTWNSELDQITSIAWKDRLNRTLQAKSAEKTSTDTISVLPGSLPLTSHILASDGRHTRVEISTERVSTTEAFLLLANMRYYQLTEKTISDGPARIIGSIPKCQKQMNLTNFNGKHEKVFKLWLLIIGSLLTAVLVGGAILWLIRKWQQWRRWGTEEKEIRRTTTPAALAEAAKQHSTTTVSFITKE